jgi:hypothetical protein
VSYARITDSFAFAAATLAVGNAAAGVYARCTAWIAAERSDGFMPNGLAEMIGNREELEALVSHGLLDQVSAGERRLASSRIGINKPDAEIIMPADGFWMPAYLAHNLTAFEGEAHAQALSDKGRKGGQASARVRSVQRQVERQLGPEVELDVNRPVLSSPVPSFEKRAMTRNEQQGARADDKDSTIRATASRADRRGICQSGDSTVPDENDAREAGDCDVLAVIVAAKL